MGERGEESDIFPAPKGWLAYKVKNDKGIETDEVKYQNLLDNTIVEEYPTEQIESSSTYQIKKVNYWYFPGVMNELTGTIENTEDIIMKITLDTQFKSQVKRSGVFINRYSYEEDDVNEKKGQLLRFS